MPEHAVILDFINSWNILHPDNSFYNRLKMFIESWNSSIKPTSFTQPQIPDLNPTKLNKFIFEILPLIKTVRAERSNGNSVNVWNVAGLGGDEIRVSSVFAWFLNCHADHGQGSSLLSAIINKLPNKPDQFPLSETIQSKPYWVHVESCASGERRSRIDIEIEGEKFLLFIEVKVFAGETNNQLERYLQIAKTKAGNRPWGIIYLTPRGKKASIQHEKLLPLSWNDVAEVFQRHANTNLPIQSYSRRLISQFSKHVSTF
jgi:hypothetical protein